MDTLLPAQNGDGLELDERWSFVGRKAQPLWLWVALCRRTRQIVAWTLGDRSLQSACELRAALPEGYRGRATRRDYQDAYAAAFPQRTHRACGKADGETCHVERWEYFLDFYKGHGYQLLVPPWPGIGSEPEEIRRDPSGLADIGVMEFVNHYDRSVRTW